MSSYKINAKAAEFAALGVSLEDVQSKLQFDVVVDSEGLWAVGRKGEAAVDRYLEEIRRAKTIEDGSRVEWRKLDGEWVLAGKNLTEGAIVTVTKKNGDTIQRRVGRILTQDSELTYAVAEYL